MSDETQTKLQEETNASIPDSEVIVSFKSGVSVISLLENIDLLVKRGSTTLGVEDNKTLSDILQFIINFNQTIVSELTNNFEKSKIQDNEPANESTESE